MTPADRWDAFWLGMSERQALWTEGFSWMERSGTDPRSGRPWRSIEAPTRVFGRPADLALSLSRDGLVEAIYVYLSIPEGDEKPASCERAFVHFVRDASVRYGAFGAALDAGTTTVSDGVRMTAETTGVPGTASAYSRVTVVDSLHEPFPETFVLAQHARLEVRTELGGGFRTTSEGRMIPGELKCSVDVTIR